MSDITTALAEAKALVAALETHDGSTTSYYQLLERTNVIRRALEEPYDKATRWVESSTASAALYILLRIGALPKLPPPGTSPGISAQALADQCHTDVSVITRCMRVLLVEGLTVETAHDEYAHNALSVTFLPEGIGSYICLCDELLKTWLRVPEYVRSHEPSDLYDLKKSPYAWAVGHEGKSYYEVLELDPEERDMWNRTLQMAEKNFPILGMFDFKAAEEEARKKGPERPFLVDVGGGRGQALRAIKNHCGGLNGLRIVLQDLPIVINSLDERELPGVELMKYDIFTPQPVKNAHIYFIRRLLHDFYNPVCIEILHNTVSAMGPDSRLLICDMLVPSSVEPGRDNVLYWMDLSLLAISGKEKTLEEFQEILDQTGLELVEVHKAPFGNTVTLETRLKTWGIHL